MLNLANSSQFDLRNSANLALKKSWNSAQQKQKHGLLALKNNKILFNLA